jgi:cytochrome oxidase assembly protein ShyY1
VRFLFTRRWILFALGVVVLALACYRLGVWQFHRLAETKAENAVVRQNLAAPPVPAPKLMGPGKPVPASEQWRRVTATGTYDAQHTVALRYQTRNGQAGIDLVTPLVTGPGPAVLVDRGWVHTNNVGESPDKLPPPPSGQVTVTGWLQPNATGSATVVTDRSTRLVSSARIGKIVPYPLYRGYIQALAESPRPAHAPLRAERPDLSNGPHFFYGLQWWFFAVLSLFGFGYLAWDERKKLRAGKHEDDAPETVSEETRA